VLRSLGAARLQRFAFIPRLVSRQPHAWTATTKGKPHDSEEILLSWGFAYQSLATD